MESGLTTQQATKILKSHGYNELVSKNRLHPILVYLRAFTNPLVIVLVVVSGMSFVLGNIADGVLVLVMVILSTLLDFVQEHRASKAAELLERRVAPRTRVWRDSGWIELDSRLIVVGDLVTYSAGSLVTADTVVNQANAVLVNQSSLTGESFPIEKKVGDTLLAGSSIVSGNVEGIVSQTGKRTQFGMIAESVVKIEKTNAFSKGIADFSATIVRIIIVFVLIVFAVNSLINGSIIESLMFAIAVAVGLTPEFLPMVMTITMSRGSVRMAKNGVIVKKLSAIPTFGSMQILCTDKTGTLTRDHISLILHQDCLGREDENVLKNGYINSFYQTGAKNPIDNAVIEYGKHEGKLPRKISEIPFDFDRRRMSVIVQDGSSAKIIIKGSPETMMEIATHYLDEGKAKKITKVVQEKIEANYAKLSAEGYRVLLVGTRKLANTTNGAGKADERDVTLVGLLAFMDPVKPGIRHALDELEAIGVQLKVITGDNEAVAKHVCHHADIPIVGMLSGSEVDKLGDHELFDATLKTSIFARCSPSQKERIISVMRAHGNVVGYMGDGINDAPSLRAADVGISVSNAMDVAKDAADIVLTKNDLLQLTQGVIEGRKTFGNTMKYILMGLSSNFGNMFSVLGAVLFLPFLPMLPIQILLNNFLYDLSQITLPLDEVDDSYVKTPKHWDMRGIIRFMAYLGPISSIFDFVAFVVLYQFFRHDPSSFQTGWFMESLATQALVIHIIRTTKLPFIQSNAHVALWITTFGVTLTGWLIPYTPLGAYLGFSPLEAPILVLLVTIVTAYLIVAEIGKQIYYRFNKN